MTEIKYDIDAGGCWVFRGYKGRGGYGIKKYKGKNWPASRLQYTLVFGEIPDGLIVLHRCDNPPCINPMHLWLGTHRDNTNDKLIKGRETNQHRNKTHCKYGHEFTPENTAPKIQPNGRIGRRCRTCNRERYRSTSLTH